MVGKLGKDAASSEWNIASRFDNLFIIDRTVDLITLMPTQLTYEGLIDECFGIHQATVRLPADKFPNMGTSSKNPDQSESGRKDAPEKKIILNSSDELYTEIRDLNFSAVGPVFSGKAKMLNAKLGVMKIPVTKTYHKNTSKKIIFYFLFRKGSARKKWPK